MQICPFLNIQGNICPCDSRCALLTHEGCSFRVIAESLLKEQSKNPSDQKNLTV